MRSGHQSSAGSLTSLYTHPTPAILVFLAVLAFGLLFMLPGGLLQAQETSSKTVEYTENDTSPVLTLSASDPEGAAPIVWSLVEEIADHYETETWSTPVHPVNVSEEGLQRVLDADTYYGFARVAPAS